jgi:hypothetical protein
MTEHDGRGALQTDAVRRAHHIEPLLRRDLVGTNMRAHFVVENLGGGAGQRAEAGSFQCVEEIIER